VTYLEDAKSEEDRQEVKQETPGAPYPDDHGAHCSSKEVEEI
jgi:hypothetical protein